MPLRSPAPRRGLVAAFCALLVGVLALDATTIAAAPAPRRTAAAPATVLPPGQLRLITWSGGTWLVAPKGMRSPSGGPISDSNRGVYVDSRHRLHLAIRKEKGKWQSVLLESLTPPDYGRYRFTIQGSTAALNKRIVLGLFVFRSGSPKLTNELDIEDSQTLKGIHPPRNAQFVVQPFDKPHHTDHYRIPASATRMSQQFTWRPGRASFVSRDLATHQVISRFTFSGKDVPTTDGEHLYVNMWLTGNQPPTGGGTRHIIISSVTR